VLGALGNDAQVTCLAKLLFTGDDSLALSLGEDQVLMNSRLSVVFYLLQRGSDSYLVDVVDLYEAAILISNRKKNDNWRQYLPLPISPRPSGPLPFTGIVISTN
jgi:hypothetical protein